MVRERLDELALLLGHADDDVIDERTFRSSGDPKTPISGLARRRPAARVRATRSEHIVARIGPGLVAKRSRSGPPSGCCPAGDLREMDRSSGHASAGPQFVEDTGVNPSLRVNERCRSKGSRGFVTSGGTGSNGGYRRCVTLRR